MGYFREQIKNFSTTGRGSRDKRSDADDGADAEIRLKFAVMILVLENQRMLTLTDNDMDKLWNMLRFPKYSPGTAGQESATELIQLLNSPTLG